MPTWRERLWRWKKISDDKAKRFHDEIKLHERRLVALERVVKTLKETPSVSKDKEILEGITFVLNELCKASMYLLKGHETAMVHLRDVILDVQNHEARLSKIESHSWYGITSRTWMDTRSFERLLGRKKE